MEQPENICANCDAPLTGEYCSRCGERRPDRARLKLSAFLGTAVQEVTDLEHSKLLRTLKILFFAPGVLTNEYLRGRRTSFLGPLKIYLLMFALSFFLYTVYQPTSVYDVRTFVNADPSGGWKAQLQRLAEITQLSEPVLIQELNGRWRRYLNLTQVIYPLSLGLVLQLLYLGRRRFFAEHLVMALHFSAVVSGLNIVFWPLYMVSGVQLTTVYWIQTNFMLFLIFVWLLVACRRVYGGSWLASGLKALLLELGYYVVGIAITLLALGWAVFSLIRSG